MRCVIVMLLVVGCESKVDKLDKAIDKLEEKVENNRVSKTLDKLDSDEATQHLQSARDAIGKGRDAPEDCSWAQRTPSAPAELVRLCTFDVPFTKASRAVTAAEKAKEAQPGAPSYTECSSDEWAAAKRTIEDKFGGDAKWGDLKARWAKVCPDAK